MMRLRMQMANANRRGNVPANNAHGRQPNFRLVVTQQDGKQATTNTERHKRERAGDRTNIEIPISTTQHTSANTSAAKTLNIPAGTECESVGAQRAC